MYYEEHKPVKLEATTNSPTAPQLEQEERATPRALPASQWLRAVTGFDAPFGHDGLPTVWG